MAAIREDGRVWDLTINLLASAIAGAAVWLTQYALRRRKLERKRRFFGLDAGSECTFFVSKHASSPRPNSVHRHDMGALLELAMVARDCGSRPEIASFDDPPVGIGTVTEFCVGGPTNNPRTARHLRWLLPGVTVSGDAELLTISAGEQSFSLEDDVFEYVLLARVFGPEGGHPVFILCGQTALSNQAAARYLGNHHRRLAREYADQPFCLALRIVDPPAYGSSVVEFVADLTAAALRAPQAAPSQEGASA